MYFFRCIFVVVWLLWEVIAAFAENAPLYSLDAIIVEDEQISVEEGRMLIGRDRFESAPGVTRDTNEVFRTIPGVQFSDSSRSSDQGGEIVPDQITISGGRAYDNAMLIDGMSTSSVLDPDVGDNPFTISQLPGHAQNIFLSPDLIESIDVYTSNIPAKFGGFAGGVIDTRLRFPEFRPWGRIKYWTTRSEWTSLHSEDPDFHSSTSQAMEPLFSRNNYDMSLNLPITDVDALLAIFSMHESYIPLEIENNPHKENRQLLNLALKYGHEFEDGGNGFLSLLHAPYESVSYKNKYLDGESLINTAPWHIQAGRDWKLDWGAVQYRLGYMENQISREADADLKGWLNRGTKTWGGIGEKFSYEGGFGDIEQSQSDLSSAIDIQMRSVRMFGIDHLVGLGFAWDSLQGQYARTEQTSVYYSPVASTKVVDPTGSYTDSEKGSQYFSKRSVYEVDSSDAALNQLAIYFDDTMKLWRFSFRPGIRVSFDDFQDNLNFAPRLMASYDLFADSNTVLIGGLNRYYGQNLLAYKLREGRLELRRDTRTMDKSGRVYPSVGATSGYWQLGTDGTSNYKFSKLDTPYSDEAVVGFDQHLYWEGIDLGNFSLRLINRWYRDEFARDRFIDDAGKILYVMNNNGKTRYKGVTGSWKKSWEKHALEIGCTVQETTTTNESYDDPLDDEALEQQVWYDGGLVDKSTLPRTNFNRPWLGSVVYTAKLPMNLSFSNVTWARGGYTALEDSGKNISINGESYDIYDRIERNPEVTFDWKLVMDVPLKGSQQLIFGVDVLNVFDAKHRVGNSNDSYELGRQFWAGLEYRF